MKRSSEADNHGPRKSSKTSHSDSETSDTNTTSTSKRDRKHVESNKDAVIAHAKPSEGLTLAQSRNKALEWSEQNLRPKQKIEKSPAKPHHSAPIAQARLEPTEAPKIRKSVIPSVQREAPPHRVVEYFEAERSHVCPVYDVPLIKIQHPKFKM